MLDFKAPEKKLSNVIELKGISQSYDGGKTFIIQDFDLTIENKPNQGEFAILMGMSGCGKSTILRYIAGIQTPTTGTVLVNGKPVGPDNRVSMVFQQYSSLPWMSVLDNVGLALRYKGISKKDRDEQAMKIIQDIGLEGHEHKYAQYPTLSGGQLQRVAIARSLASNPDILLMDEPFGALDVKNRLQMQDLLINIWDKYHSTILFVTHDLDEAVYLGDDIYIMKYSPSNISKHIYVDLPFNRTRKTKREKRFNELVLELEDAMLDLATLK
jgi:NitT/TauT family transport system ATP-binding protein